MPEYPWLDETKIGVTAQPYFFVDIFGISNQAGKAKKYVIDRTQIVEATIEGKAPKARRGSFRFIDPTGEWPDKLANAGAYSNSIGGKGKPNLRVHFGWQNLIKNKTTQEEMTHLSGLILKTKFSIDPETAMTTIEVEYIEAMMSWFRNLRFLDVNDMIILDQIRNNDLKDMSVSDLLTYIWDHSSIKESLDAEPRTDIQVNFNGTGSDSEVDGRKFKIRFGDGFEEKINEISAQAKREVIGESEDEDKVWSYERMNKDDELMVGRVDENSLVNLEYSGVIEYDWKPAPADGTEEGVNVGDTWGSEDLIDGPKLLWKTQKNDPTSKIMLTWDSDLNSKEYLIHQARDELTKTLSQYSDSDWNALQQFLKYARDENTSQVTQGSLDRAMAELEKNSEASGIGQFFGRIFGNSTWDMTDENRIQLVETLVTETQNLSGNPAKQMDAIIASNVFQGQATILGDPNFGTTLLPYKVKMPMVFEDVGEFATLFQRDWLLTNVIHRFGEGTYITEIKLLTYPEQNPHVDTYERSTYTVGTAEDNDASVVYVGDSDPTGTGSGE